MCESQVHGGVAMICGWRDMRVSNKFHYYLCVQTPALQCYSVTAYSFSTVDEYKEFGKFGTTAYPFGYARAFAVCSGL